MFARHSVENGALVRVDRVHRPPATRPAASQPAGGPTLVTSEPTADLVVNVGFRDGTWERFGTVPEFTMPESGDWPVRVLDAVYADGTVHLLARDSGSLDLWRFRRGESRSLAIAPVPRETPAGAHQFGAGMFVNTQAGPLRVVVYDTAPDEWVPQTFAVDEQFVERSNGHAKP